MSIKGDLVAAFEPWMTPDLQDYLEAIGTMFEEGELYFNDTDDGEGWEVIFDPDLCPVQALPHLAQYVGEVLPVGISEAAAREWIKDAPNKIRGTIFSIVYAAQRSLIGNRTVTIRERYDSGGGVDVDHLTLTTYSSETPDAVQVLADLRTVVPADIVLHYSALGGQTWQSVKDSAPSGTRTWTNVKAVTGTYTWRELSDTIPEGVTYTRPRP